MNYAIQTLKAKASQEQQPRARAQNLQNVQFYDSRVVNSSSLGGSGGLSYTTSQPATQSTSYSANSFM